MYFTPPSCLLQIQWRDLLSDHMFNDVNMIHEIQRLVIENLKAELSHISQVFLSDACAAQY